VITFGDSTQAFNQGKKSLVLGTLGFVVRF
jgi:hypothetical protein